MEELHIVGLEDGSLVLAGPGGDRYTLPIDDSLHARIRQSIPADQGNARKLSPKEIQAHIRGGLSAIDVAQITGAPLEYIERFEGPVMAEREYVVESALAIPVHLAAADPLAQATTFGDAILERLHILDAVGERWSAWKEAAGWVVKLGYMLGAIEHDARWHFDPKRQTLSPINAEAVGLSRQDPGHDPEPPRLRAVVPLRADDEPMGQSERFDSGAFSVDPSSMSDSGPVLAPIGSRPLPRQQDSGHDQTADLLEALRRRRGERETPTYEDEPTHGGTMHVVELDLNLDIDLEVDERPTGHEPASTHKTGGFGARKGRPQMPSWDEIVFGARSDDDDPA